MTKQTYFESMVIITVALIFFYMMILDSELSELEHRVEFLEIVNE